MAKLKGRKKSSGKKRMREFGYRLCEVWFDASEFKILETLQRITAKPLSTLVRELAVAAATDAITAQGKQTGTD